MAASMTDVPPARFEPRLLGAEMSSQHESHSWTLPPKLVVSLRAPEKRSECHRYLISALRILHFRHTGVEKASMPVLCHRDPIIETTAHLDITGDVSVREVLQACQQEMAEAIRTTEATEIEEKAEKSLQAEAPAESSPLRGQLSFEYWDSEDENISITRKSSMVWHCFGPARCRIDYDQSCYHPSTIESLAINFVDVLHALLESSDTLVTDVEFPGSRDQLTSRGYSLDPRTTPDLPSDLIASFQTTVSENEFDLAIVQGDLTLTYHELDLFSSYLARRLLAERRSDPPDEYIAFCLPTSALAVAVMIAILKTGSAYMPIDIRQAPERVLEMLQTAKQPRIIVSKDSPLFIFNPEFKAWTIDVSRDQDEWLSNPTFEDPDFDWPARHPVACLLFTSGTTGKPKGVRILHRNLLALNSNKDAIRIESDDRVAQTNNLAWDAHFFDVLFSLLNGATIYPFSRLDVLNPSTLTSLFQQHDITVALIPTALLRHVLNESPELLETVRYLVTGGEMGRFEVFTKAREVKREMVITNVYGPTECCIFSTYFNAEPATEIPKTGNVPVGRPLDTTLVVVLDARGRLVPPGIIGEIFIAGHGVSGGYEGLEPEKQAAFSRLDIPGIPGSSQMFYRTGDLARWNAEGHLEFCGRVSLDQIKIRGQRLELADVEANIAAACGVQDVGIAYCKLPGHAEGSLVGYLVPDIALNGADDRETGHIERNTETWERFYTILQSGDSTYPAREEFVGWNSAITGVAFPKHEMEAWLEDTMRPFRRYDPKNVLEVGCGNGIIAYQMIDTVNRFYGIDPSASAIEQLQFQFEQRQASLAQKASMWAKPADELRTLPDFAIDFVIINSVVQYFPSLRYLERVIEACLQRFQSGGHQGSGHIVLGDIRSAPLNDLMAVEMAQHQWGSSFPDKTVQDLRAEVHRWVQSDPELLVDPSFLWELPRRYPALTHIEVVPKTYPYSNELSRYRFQAILHVGPGSGTEPLDVIEPATWIAPGSDDPYLQRLPQLIQDFVNSDQSHLAIERIPNRYLLWSKAIMDQAVAGSTSPDTPLGRLSVEPSHQQGWFAPDLMNLASQHGLHVQLSWARQSDGGILDAVFTKTAISVHQIIRFPSPQDRVFHSQWSPYFESSYQRNLIQGPSWQGMMDQLTKALPAYMIPSACYYVDYIPMTLNGKVDRRTLERLAKSDSAKRVEDRGTSVGYRNDTERRICDLFGSLLGGGASITPSTNFFARGGHSLLASRLRFGLRDEFRVTLSLWQIFESPTPEGLAAHIMQHEQGNELALPEGHMTQSSSQLGTELSFAQLRMWFLYHLHPDDTTAYNSGMICCLRGDADIDALKRSLLEIVSRQDIFRTTFFEDDGVPKSRVTDDMPDVPTIDFRGRTEQNALDFVTEQYYRRYDIINQPPIRLAIYQLDASVILLIGMHHIITDGYSLEVLSRELRTIYPAFRRGQPSPLPKLAYQYRDFARWQHSREFQRLIEPQMDYWMQQLRGSQPASIPADRSLHDRAGVGFADGTTLKSTMDESLRAQLDAVRRKSSVTWFILLAAAFRAVHFQMTGQADASFCFPNANRRRVEITSLVGFFVNTQVLRLRCHEGMSFQELLQHARSTSFEAMEHQDVPFERLVKDLNPRRRANQNPLGDIMLGFHNWDLWHLNFDGTPAEMSDWKIETSRFDVEVQWFDQTDQMELNLTYRTGMYQRSTMEALQQRLMGFLYTILEDGDITLRSDGSSQDSGSLPLPRKDDQWYQQRDYWRQTLEGYTSANLPTDHPRPTKLSGCQQSFSLEISTDLRQAVFATAKALNIGPASLFVSAYVLLLRTYSSQDDLVFGMPVELTSNEPSDAHSTPADRSNLVGIRAQHHPQVTRRALINEVSQQLEGAEKNRHFAFGDLVRALHAQASSDRHPIFQHLLALESFDALGPSPSPEFMASLPAYLSRSNLDLATVITPSEICFYWPNELFEEQSIVGLARTFQRLLQQLIDPEALDHPLSTLSLADHYSILTSSPVNPDPSTADCVLLGQLFEHYTRRFGDSVAVVCQDQRMTYDQLDARSNQLAHYLHGLGLRSGQPLGMMLNPSIDMIACILAVWKIGAAYIPLSTNWPQARLKDIVDDASFRLLLTTRLHGRLFDGDTDMTVLEIDQEHVLAEIAKAPSTYTSPRISPTSPAYCIYTSGTTGRPKGVSIQQKSVVHLAKDLRARYFGGRPDAAEALPMTSNFAFDLSIEQMILTILSGNKLVLLPHGISAIDADEEYLVHESITFLSATPSVVSKLDLSRFSSLRTVVVGGEQFHRHHFDRIRRGFSGPIFNGMGTTETTVYNSSQKFDGSSFANSLGHPIAGHQLYISNESFQRLPPGAIGELFISGEGVSPGYLNQPRLTRERFLTPNPFLDSEQRDQCGSAHRRVYRTGDLVRLSPHGRLEYFGRNDQQVQLRGLRIELGEIQSTIVAYPGILECAVLGKTRTGVTAATVDFIVGYYTTDTVVSEVQLREHLAERLPASFMPQFLVRVPGGLPVNSNGKLDPHRLPAVNLTLVGERVAPRTDLEVYLCRIWSTVLGTNDIGVSDDFFALGGDSITAIVLANRVNQRHSSRLTVQDVFDFPTVAAMAELIESRARSQAHDVPGHPVSTSPDIAQDPMTDGIPVRERPDDSVPA